MCSLLFGDREESMRILSEEEISRFADELVQWKKSTVATWEHIAEHMFFISAIDEFRSSDEESYLFYRYKILDVAKQKIFEEQKKNSRNGISAWHEKWCWLENLYHPYQWETFQKQMSNWSPARMDLVSHQSLDIVNYLSNPLKLDTKFGCIQKRSRVWKCASRKNRTYSGHNCNVRFCWLQYDYCAVRCDEVFEIANTRSLET